MSRITRRTFLRTCTTVASLTTLAACSWHSVTPLSTGIGQSQLTIWSTPGNIDQALARWRRINPSVNVRRQIVASADLQGLLQSLSTRATDIPDVIIADSYSLVAQANTDLWRQFERTTIPTGIHQAALGHVHIDDRRIIGLPLTVNPLKLWYQSDILSDTLGFGDSTQVSAAIGASWDSFESFVSQFNRSNPIVTALSSCYDDMCYPLAVDKMQQQQSLSNTFVQGYMLAQQQLVGRAIHFGGEWFNLLKRNSLAMIVGGRSMSTAVARTWNSETKSAWQAISHPLGDLYGPCIVAAIPIQAPDYEQATQFIIDLVTTPELQILISNERMNMPSLLAANEHSEMQRVDAILPERTIRDTWSTQANVQPPMIHVGGITQLQTAKKLFYAWQNKEISDVELQNSLETMEIAAN